MTLCARRAMQATRIGSQTEHGAREWRTDMTPVTLSCASSCTFIHATETAGSCRQQPRRLRGDASGETPPRNHRPAAGLAVLAAHVERPLGEGPFWMLLCCWFSGLAGARGRRMEERRGPEPGVGDRLSGVDGGGAGVRVTTSCGLAKEP